MVLVFSSMIEVIHSPLLLRNISILRETEINSIIFPPRQRRYSSYLKGRVPCVMSSSPFTNRGPNSHSTNFLTEKTVYSFPIRQREFRLKYYESDIIDSYSLLQIPESSCLKQKFLEGKAKTLSPLLCKLSSYCPRNVQNAHYEATFFVRPC